MRIDRALIASFVLLAASVCRSAAQAPPDIFRDVPTDHWAYQAAEELRQKGVLIGYPDGYFRGKRTLTRYEFAVALDRAVKIWLTPPPESGWGGPQGLPGRRGPAGPRGIPPEEVATFRALAREFRDDLAALGNNSIAIQQALDSVERDVADLNARLAHQPRIFGGAGLFVRADQRHGTYVDRDGRFNGIAGPGTLKGSDYGNPAAVHEFVLGVAADLPGRLTLDAAITANSYKDFLGGSLSQVHLITRNAPSDTYLHYAELGVPLNTSGTATATLGRYRERVTHLTLWRPTLDSYWVNPFENDGCYYLDGVRLRARTGSLSVEAFGGDAASVQGTTFGAWNVPLAGVAAGPAGVALYNLGMKPAGQAAVGQMAADRLVGVSGDVRFHTAGSTGGHVTLAAVDAMNPITGPIGVPLNNVVSSTFPAGNGFDNVLALGAQTDIQVTQHIAAAAEWGKTITGHTLWQTVNAAQNNAADARVGWGSGRLNLGAGYRYIEPHFYNPGDWGRLGNWIDPTNLMGPNVNVGFEISRTLGVGYREEFYRVTHDESQSGGLGFRDAVNRVMVNVHWRPAHAVTISADWEGIYYRLVGPHSGIPLIANGRVDTPENYTTLELKYDVSAAARLRLSYNIGSFQGKHSVFMGPNTEQNFNVLTAQMLATF